MQRKVLKRGYCTSLISLPREWVLQNGIEPGNLLSLDVKSKEIVLRAHNEENRVTIDASDIGEWRTHYFSQLYERGYDEIVFTHLDAEQELRILERLDNFPHARAARTGSGTLEIRIADSKHSHAACLKQLFERTFEILALVREGLERPTRRTHARAARLLKELCALDELTTRKINKEVPEIESFYLHNVPASLLFIARTLVPCVEYALEKQVRTTSQTLRYVELIERYLKDHYRSRYHGQRIDYKQHLAIRKELHDETLTNFEVFATIPQEEIFVLEKALYAARLAVQIYSRNTLFTRKK